MKLTSNYYANNGDVSDEKNENYIDREADNEDHFGSS